MVQSTNVVDGFAADAEPICYVNGARKVLPPERADATLLQWLREEGLTGTKLGCGEGGCGACTVMVSHWEEGRAQHRAVNACLCPLYAVEGMQVVTVEGIGNVRQGLHPVQAALATSHGSQCGFCTPGFVMSMYALLRERAAKGLGPPTEEDIEECLAGNLCRCTGYRPILDAFKVFAKSDPAAYTEDAIAAAKGATVNGSSSAVNGGSNGQTGSGGKICPSSGLPCDCGAASVTNGTSNSSSGGTNGGGGCSATNGGCGKAGCKAAAAVAPCAPVEPIFPSELKSRSVLPLKLPGPLANWYRPTSLEQLLALKAAHPELKLVGGNSEVGIEMKFKAAGYKHLAVATAIPELNQVTVTEDGVELGASITLTRLQELFQQLIQTRPSHQTSGLRAVVEQLRWFAGRQIRNVGTLGGNIVTASPISDLNPLWMAMGATFVAVGPGGKQRGVAAEKFFLAYRKVDLAPEEVLLKVVVPFTRQFEYVKEFKQAPRRDDDIAIVNAGMRVKFTPSDTGDWLVEEVSIAYGGVAPKSIMAERSMAALRGHKLGQTALTAALTAVKEDVAVPVGAPGGRAEYRNSLAASFLFKFYVGASLSLERDSSAVSTKSNGGQTNGVPAYKAEVEERERSAAAAYHRPPSKGVQFFAKADASQVVGQDYRHMSADYQVCGQAQYCDDVPLANPLHAAFVTSCHPHAKILGVDPSGALAMEGVVGYFGAKDVPGDNIIGPVKHDEEVFATEVVTCVGQVIGVVVAESEPLARRAARAVQVTYDPLPAVLSIEDAIAANSFYGEYKSVITDGDVDAAFGPGGPVEKVVEGQFRLGGQEHFYLEPQNCLVVPSENDEYLLLSSTQAPGKHHKYVASVLGLPQHKLVSKTKRIGGGFGGKETRSIFLHCAAAVASYHTRRPVKAVLDRDEDMQMSGHRHPFLATYKVGFDAAGTVHAIDLDLYHNAGNSWDLSHSIMDRALGHSDCCYKIPHVRVRGHMCYTHMSSNTAFRGFGGPQGMMFAEMWMDRVAREVGVAPWQLRGRHLYAPQGDVTHFGQQLEHCHIRKCWDKVVADSQLAEREAAAAQFNSLHRWRKRGITATPTKFGISFTTKFLNQAGALVHIYTDGSVLVTHGGVEMGQGLHTKVAQVAAQALGVPLSKVFIAETSTDKVPNPSPTAASASSDMYGGAVLDACRQLQERLEGVKAAMAGEGAVNPSFFDLVNRAYLDRVDLSAHGFYATPDITGFGGTRPFNYFVYGAAVSEVELDVLTGDWQLLRTDIVMDVGNPINPAIDIGQVEGGFVQGMGWLCMEELIWGDKEHPWVRPGHLFTKGPGTYKIPTVNDIPVDFRVELLREVPNPRAIHSSKAVGEPPFHLGASVFFALKEAVAAARAEAGHPGWFLLEAPATPERLRLLCADPIAAGYVTPDVRPAISC